MAPTDEELLELMPQGFRDDLALVSRMAAHGAGPEVQPGLFRVTLNTGALDYARAVWDRARALLAQPGPEVVGPSVEELDDLFNEIDQSGEPLSWRAYARAVLSRWGRPAPAPAGEVGELVAWLRAWARGTLEEGQPATSRSLTRIADLLEQRKAAPVPVAIADRLPTPSECDRGRCWWGRQVNSRRWSWTFSIDPQGDTHWLPATVERLPANIVPVLPEDAQVIEPTKRTIRVPAPVLVAIPGETWITRRFSDRLRSTSSKLKRSSDHKSRTLMAINVSCRTCYPGDSITDHNELIKVLRAMDARIQQLEAEVRSLKMPNDAPPRPSLYDASAHVRPKP